MQKGRDKKIKPKKPDKFIRAFCIAQFSYITLNFFMQYSFDGSLVTDLGDSYELLILMQYDLEKIVDN